VDILLEIGCICHFSSVCQIEISIFIHLKDKKDDPKFTNGVVWGGWSLESLKVAGNVILFDLEHNFLFSFYSTYTRPILYTVSEILRFVDLKSQIFHTTDLFSVPIESDPIEISPMFFDVSNSLSLGSHATVIGGGIFCHFDRKLACDGPRNGRTQ